MKRLLVALVLTGCAHPAPGPFPQLEKIEGQRAPEGNFVINAEPEDATVAIDGVTQGLARDFDGINGALHLSPGAHELTVSKPGYEPYSSTIFAASTGQQRLPVRLNKP